jgi:hypothetical protein
MRIAIICPLMCLAFVGGFFSGCSGPKKLDLYAVEGKVLVKGQPAVGALVVFHPQEQVRENDHKPFAIVKDDGTYRLTTFNPDDGAAAGAYVVTVVWNAKVRENKMGFVSGDGPAVGADRLGGRYGDPKNGPLKKTVEPKPNQIDLTLD